MLLSALLAVSSTYAEMLTPDELVKNTTNEVLEILRADQDAGSGDMNRIGKLVEDKIASKFDFYRMSGMVLRQQWNRASRAEQEGFIAEFRSLLVRTYSSALSKYRNQTIEYRVSHSKPGDTSVRVRTQIIQPGGPTIPLDYNLQKNDEAWKVYDVIIDGLSLISIYRGQFAAEMKQNGINGVTQRLVEKNRGLPKS